jgi:hypothetical protein
MVSTVHDCRPKPRTFFSAFHACYVPRSHHSPGSDLADNICCEVHISKPRVTCHHVLPSGPYIYIYIFSLNNVSSSLLLSFLSSPRHDRRRHESYVNRQNVKLTSTSQSSEQLFVNVIALNVLRIVNRWQLVSGTRCYVTKTEGEVWRNRDGEVYWLVAARSRKPPRENELSVLSDE